MPGTAAEDPSVAFFKNGGQLSQTFAGYHQRDGQISMVRAISDRLKQPGHLIVEAGTGIGKSFAYLIPFLMRQPLAKPIVVSTATIALQEQLLHKDIPQISKSLDRPIVAVLAKGRSNYICEDRLEKARSHAASLAESPGADEQLAHWANLAREIHPLSRSDLPHPISPELWPHVCSEVGICSSTQCKKRNCSFYAARQKMKNADILIVNHSLLLVHLKLAQAGVQLLPAFRSVVIDEAHHLPAMASEQLGIRLTNSGFKFFLDRLWSGRGKGFLARLQPTPVKLQRKVHQLREQYEQFFSVLAMWKLSEGPENGRIRKAVDFEDPLSDPLFELADLLGNWASSAVSLEEERELRHYAERSKDWALQVRTFIEQRIAEAAYWVELSTGAHGRQRVNAHVAPVDVAPALRAMLFEQLEHVILTSATLSTGAREPFNFFKKRCGAELAESLSLPSPFDLNSQVRLLTTRKLPPPDHESWFEKLLLTLKRCLALSNGGAFILVTSFSLLERLHHHLRQEAEEKGYLLLAQGVHGQRSELLRRFREHDHAVLLGNHSFWEGVDIPGPRLRNVIIPRLPFDVPDHPLLETQYELIQLRGGQPFAELALPSAIMRIRQGVGRLIRHRDDMGLIFILDSRIHSKPYGSAFLKALSLPQCTDTLPEEAFLKRLRAWSGQIS